MTTSNTITKEDLKNVLNEVLPACEIKVKTFSKSVSWSGQSYTDIAVSIPNGATVVATSITQQPNPNWIYCGIASYDTTSVRVAYNNTYSGTISGTIEVAVFYTA